MPEHVSVEAGDGRETWYLTFGVQYELEPHPVLPDLAHPDGVVAVIAEDYHQARAYVTDRIGGTWSDLMEERTWQVARALFPRGILATWNAAPRVLGAEGTVAVESTAEAPQ
jgi:hypothetical protein